MSKSKYSAAKELANDPGRPPYAMVVPDLELLKTRWLHSASLGKQKFYFSHGTAGWQNQTGKSFVTNFIKRGLCTDFMEENGNIFVQRPWGKWGSHLGAGIYKGKKISSKEGAGIEIAVGGKLTLGSDGVLRTWFGKEVEKSNARYVTKAQGYNSEGWFEKLTQHQENALIKHLKFIVAQNPDIILLEHSDVSGYRGKTDLDGCLSMPFKIFILEKVYR